jgi:hypothetical protein
MSEQQSQADLMPYDSAFLARIEAFRKDWHEDYMNISRQKTPQYDRNGEKIIKQRPWDNLDYVPEGYMRKKLDRYFPGWSWLPVGETQVLVALWWVIVDGQLAIIDPRLVSMGINPPYRYFRGNGGARIAFKKDQPPSAASIVDLDKVVKSANSEALKVAINRLTFICDDVYGKRGEVEGVSDADVAAGIVEIPTGAAQRLFTDYVKHTGKPYSEVFKALGVANMSGVKDYGEALRTLQKAWG